MLRAEGRADSAGAGTAYVRCAESERSSLALRGALALQFLDQRFHLMKRRVMALIQRFAENVV
jgi:hypothetical protein